MVKRKTLTEHQIHGTDHSDRISQQMATSDMVKTAEMREAWSTNMHAVRPLAAIANHVHAHLALGGLDGGVGVTRWHSIALGEEQEVVNQCLHVLFHGSAGRRRNLVVLVPDGASWHLVEALVDDTQRLTELFHAAQVPVVAVAVDAHGYVELDLVVGVVGRGLAHVPGHSGAAEHDAREGEVEGIGRGDDTNALETVDPDAVIREHLLGFVDAVAELSRPLIDVVEQADGDVLVNTAGPDIGSVQTGTGDALVEFLGGNGQLLGSSLEDVAWFARVDRDSGRQSMISTISQVLESPLCS